MKTVKEYICTLNEKRLVDTYFNKYSKTLSCYINGSPLSDKKDERIMNLTIAEFTKDQKNLLHEYIDYLRNVDIIPNEKGKQGIIYAYSKLEGYYYWSGTMETVLVYMDELQEDPENCNEYDYMLTKFSEILGFLVADNQYTQGNIYEVIADVMYVASWYGYRQEGLDEEIGALEESSDKFEEGRGTTYASVDTLFTDLLGEEGFKEMQDSMYHETDEEKKLRHDAQKARYEYEHYSNVKERKIIVGHLQIT